MIKLLLSLAALGMTQAGTLCDDCKSVTSALDHYDPTDAAQLICPALGDLEDVCDHVAPYLIGYVQDTGILESFCDDICLDTGSEHDHHHLFDIPHESIEEHNENRPLLIAKHAKEE